MSYTLDQLKSVSSAKDVLKLVGFDTPPYNPFEIASVLGLSVSQDFDFNKMQISGSITPDVDGSASIWINPMDITVRKKFTLAHELGHYFHDILKENHKGEIPDTPDTLYRNTNNSDVCEQRANNFAAELLMPSGDVLTHMTRIINEAPDGQVTIERLIEELASVFEVSLAAITVRLKHLGVINQSYQG